MWTVVSMRSQFARRSCVGILQQQGMIKRPPLNKENMLNKTTPTADCTPSPNVLRLCKVISQDRDWFCLFAFSICNAHFAGTVEGYLQGFIRMRMTYSRIESGTCKGLNCQTSMIQGSRGSFWVKQSACKIIRLYDPGG